MDRLVISGPVETATGESLLIGQIPVFQAENTNVPGRFSGLLSMTIDIDALFTAAGVQYLEDDYRVAIRGRDASGPNGAIFYGDAGILDHSPRTVTISLPFGTWQALAIPGAGWPERGDGLEWIVFNYLLGAALLFVRLLFAGRVMAARLIVLTVLDFQNCALDEHAIVSTTDVRGNITYAKKKFCEVSGFTETELLDQNHRIVRSGTHTKEFYREMWRTIARGDTWHGEMKNRRKGGNFYWVAATILPLMDTDTGKPVRYIGIRTDITQEKETELALAEAMELANQANEAKTQFLAAMSHEIRTPMTGVMGFADLILENDLDDDSRNKVCRIRIWRAPCSGSSTTSSTCRS
ncbi:MAG: PAS domain S-box protein [Rhodospirillaceae bacterium]